MERALIDTDTLPKFFKGRENYVLRNANARVQSFDKMTVSSMTVYEVVRGLGQFRAQARLARFYEWEQDNETIVPKTGDFVVAVQIVGRRVTRSKTLHFADTLVATAALRPRLPLVTGNTADFRAVQEAG